MGLCRTAVVIKGAELGVQRVSRSTGEGVVGRAKAAATVRVEVVAAVGNGPPGGHGAIPARRAVSNDRVLERYGANVVVNAAAGGAGAIAGESGVAHR